MIFCYVKNVLFNQGDAALLRTDSGPDLIQKNAEKSYFIRVWRLRGTFFYCSGFLRRKLSFLKKEDIFNIKKCPPFRLLKRTKCTWEANFSCFVKFHDSLNFVKHAKFWETVENSPIYVENSPFGMLKVSSFHVPFDHFRCTWCPPQMYILSPFHVRNVLFAC